MKLSIKGLDDHTPYKDFVDRVAHVGKHGLR